MRIEIRGVLGIEAAALDLVPGEVLEVCGPNRAGKTSIATTCQALLAGDANPLGLPVAEMRAYRNDETDEARAILTDSDEGEWEVRWNPTRSEGAIEVIGEAAQSHPMAVGAVDFMARMPAKSRAALLQSVLLPDPAEVLAKLRADLAAYLPERDIEGVVAEIEQRGFEAAASVYEDRMRRAKREWCDITGRSRWGSKIAADWRPPGWTADHDALTVEEAARLVEEARAARDEMLREVVLSEAQVLAAETARAELPGLNAALSEIETELAGLRDAERTAQIALGEASERVRERRDKLAALDAQGKAIKAEAGATEPPHTCPHCGGGLDIGHQWTGVGVSAWTPPDTEAIEKRLNEMREARIEMTRDLEVHWGREKDAREALQTAQEARKACDAREAKAQAKASQVRETAALKGAPDTEARRMLRAQADERVQAAQAVEKDVEKAKKAAAQADSVAHYEAIARAIGPSGARAGLTEKRLATLQAGLAVVCGVADWPPVTVSLGGQITVGGRSVALCTSERWRAQTALQLTIGAMTKSAAVVLDAADLLDRDGRAGLVRALTRVAERTGMAIVVCATGEPLDDPPWRQVVVAGGRTVDVETGEVAG